jgi:hypothetical protein
MNGNTIQNMTLVCFIIVLSSILTTNKNAQATDPKPFRYLEVVNLYGGDYLYGESDDLPEEVPFGETFTYEDEFVSHKVVQGGYVLTSLAPFGLSPDISIPLIEVADTTTVSVSPGLLNVSPHEASSRGFIYFYGEVINTTPSGNTRMVPLKMQGRCTASISPSGRALGRAETKYKVRELNLDYSYKPGHIINERITFCKLEGDVYGRVCMHYDNEPGTIYFEEEWSAQVSSGATQPFEVSLEASCYPEILAASEGLVSTDESSSYCKVSIDPFIYIDPEWEYADQYTLKLSPGMYVGPMPPKSILSEIISNLQMLAGMENSPGEHGTDDINEDGRIGLEEIIHSLQIVSGLR